jgi:hypothetical protein
MTTLGVGAKATQPILKSSISAVLEALEIVFNARTAALASLNPR